MVDEIPDRFTTDSSRFTRRDSLRDGRDEPVQLAVYADTHEQEKDARRELEDRLCDDLYKLDMREAIYRAGMENLDDGEEILRKWGANIERYQ